MPTDSKSGNKPGSEKHFFKKFFGRRHGNGRQNGRLDTATRYDHIQFYMLLSLGVIALSTLFFVPSNQIDTKSFSEGEVVRRNIYSHDDILIEDTISTRLKRQNAADSVKAVYDLDLEPLTAVSGRIDEAFAVMIRGYKYNVPEPYKFVMRELEIGETAEDEASLAKGGKERSKIFAELKEYEKSKSYSKLEKEFVAALGLKVSDETLKLLRWHHYGPQIAGWLKEILGDLMRSGVTHNKSFLPETSRNGITIVNAASGTIMGQVKLDDFYDMDEAAGFVRKRIREVVPSRFPSLKRELTKLLGGMLQPNLTYNKSETLRLKNRASMEVSPVYFQVKKGELIVREGEKLTPVHLLKLEGISEELKKGSRTQSVGGMMLFLALVVIVSWIYIDHFAPDFADSRSNVVLLGLIFVGQIALLRLFGAGAEVFAIHKPDIEFSSYLYAAPFAVAPLLAAIFFSREVTLLVALVTAVSSGFLYDPQQQYLLVALAGGMTAVFEVGRIKRRTDIWKAGLRIMGANLAAIAISNTLGSMLFSATGLENMIFGALGGVIVVGLTLTFLPLIELSFPVVSDIKLLELQDLNHPLLARMAVQAPGTYHHSVIVGNLAEDAAEAIEANPLLTRVGSYFHDIGKMDKPEYFIENQRDSVNPHDKLTPSMSALILLSHVTKGLEMAKEHKLIPQIRDMIVEHHGMQLIKYFYQRAKDQEKPGMSPVKEDDFRYSGRKPRTRESAIVALADSVEAVSRTLKNPNSSRLKQVVLKVINDKFLSGQLDDSHLTLQDMKKIAESFVRILHGVVHYRVEYPEENLDDKTADNNEAGSKITERYKDQKKISVDFERIE